VHAVPPTAQLTHHPILLRAWPVLVGQSHRRPDAEVPDMIVFEEMEVPISGGVFSGAKEPTVMPNMAALLSYRSEEGARAMKDHWDGGALRPQQVCRMGAWMRFCGVWASAALIS